MRLIDADKTIDIIDNEMTIEDSLYNDGLCRAIQIIGNQPTVKAIPIEWIINKCNKADDLGMGIDDWSAKDCYKLVLEDWKKEMAEVSKWCARCTIIGFIGLTLSLFL